MKTSARLHNFFALAALGVMTFSTTSSTPAQTIPKGDIVVDLVDIATVPPSDNLSARVNVLRAAPDGRIFVNDQRGLMYVVSDSRTTGAPYLDLASYTALLQDNGERGFQSFAFHPDFGTPGTAGYRKFYTMASQSDTTATATFTPGVAGAGRDHDEVLLEWTAADPAAATFAPVDPTHPFREVLRIARPNGNHNAGYISFNPTAGTGPDHDNLYIGTGDSGGGGDPLGLSQMPGKVYGAVLRINPLLPDVATPIPSANGQYSIPADNPFVSSASVLHEKYLMGFRNPQRFVWDPANGRLFVADIGQNRVEEIDVAQAGANYGWNQREGSYVYNGDGSIGANVRTDGASTGFTYPIAEYLHFGSNGNAVTTGPVYRGDGIPGLDGRLLFCDFPNGVPYTLDANNLPDGGSDGVTELRLRVNGTEASFLDIIRQVNPGATRADLRFGTDADNNIYFLNKQDGVIRRVVTQTVVHPPVETPVVTVMVDQTTLSRAAGQQARITFTRTGDTSTTLLVPYFVGGQLVAGRDFAVLKGFRKIKAGKASAGISLVPTTGGGNGKVTVTARPGNGFIVDPTARRAKVLVTD